MWAMTGAQPKTGISALGLLQAVEIIGGEALELGEADKASWRRVRSEIQVVLESVSHLRAARGVKTQGGVGDWLEELAGKEMPGAGITQQQPLGEQQSDFELAGARPVEGPQKVAGKAVPVAARKSRDKRG